MSAGSPSDDVEEPSGEPGGGSGGPSLPTKNDCKLFALALKSRWEIPATTRKAMVRELSAVVKDKGLMQEKPRLYLACVKALATLDGVNLRSVDTAIRAQQADELAERMAEVERRLAEDDR